MSGSFTLCQEAAVNQSTRTSGWAWSGEPVSQSFLEWFARLRDRWKDTNNSNNNSCFLLCLGKLCLTNIIEDKSVASCLDNTATSGLEGEPKSLERALQNMLGNVDARKEPQLLYASSPLTFLSQLAGVGDRVGWFGGTTKRENGGKYTFLHTQYSHGKIQQFDLSTNYIE